MSQFVEECRREWKRLGVPDPVANEMAADLEADLEEAEAEGASAEDVLGSAAFDPRSFALSWATERGVIPQPAPVSRDRNPRGSRTAVAIAAFALIAIIGGTLVVTASPSGSRRLALAPAFGLPRLRFVVPPRLRLVPQPPPAYGAWHAMPSRLRVVPWFRVSPPPPASSARVFAVDINGSGVDLRPLGLLLLFVGAVGTILSMLYWSPWATGQGLRRRTYGDERPS